MMEKCSIVPDSVKNHASETHLFSVRFGYGYVFRKSLYCNENVPELVELQGVLQYSIVVKSSDVFVCGIEHQSIAVVQTRRYRDVYRTSSFLSNIMVWPC